MNSRVGAPFIAAMLAWILGPMQVASAGTHGGPAGGSPGAQASRQLQLLADVHAIEQLTNRQFWDYIVADHRHTVDELFAMNEPDVSWGEDPGYWVGPENVRDAYVAWFDRFRSDALAGFSKKHPEVANVPGNLGAGFMGLETASIPIIEVAGDRQTAKALYYIVGQVIMVAPDGTSMPKQMWERFAADYKLEKGKWRIWHVFIHTDLALDPGQSWAMDLPTQGQGAANPNSPPPGAAPGVGEFQAPSQQTPRQVKGPSQPGSYFNQIEFPRIPVPYRTFSETFSYGPSTTDATFDLRHSR